MERSTVIAGVLVLVAGLLLGIPPLSDWLTLNLDGPWIQLLVGWACVIAAVIVFFERK